MTPPLLLNVFNVKYRHMAKKGPRQTYGLKCAECGKRNYVTTKNKTNAQVKNQGKLELNKYCPSCRKHQSHKEVQKLK